MRRIEIDIYPDTPHEIMKGFETTGPFERYAEAKEIAEMALFLASDYSVYITGSTHVVDGGMLTGQ